MRRVDELIDSFERVARGMLMLGERPPRSVDEAVSTGEKLSALLLSARLMSKGVRAEAVNAAEMIVTDAVFGSASPLMDESIPKIRRRLAPLLEAGTVPIVTGFQWSHPRRPTDNARPRRIRFLGFHPGVGLGGGRTMDLDRRRRHHDR